MEALKNRKTAWIILIAVILIMTPLGMKLSLERAVRKVEDGFEEGVEVRSGSTTYVANSVTKYAGDAVNQARGLVSTANNVSELSREAKRLSDARIHLDDAKSRDDVYAALLEVSEAARALERAGENVTMSASDRKNWDAYSKDLTNALDSAFQQVNNYNSAVDAFCEDVLGKFPASLIARLLSVDAPERLGGGS